MDQTAAVIKLQMVRLRVMVMVSGYGQG